MLTKDELVYVLKLIGTAWESGAARNEQDGIALIQFKNKIIGILKEADKPAEQKAPEKKD